MSRTKTAVTIIFALFIFSILGCMIFMTKNINITSYNYNVKVNDQFEVRKMTCTSKKITFVFDGNYLNDKDNGIFVYCYDANSTLITNIRVKVDMNNNRLKISSDYIEYIDKVVINNNELKTVLSIENLRSTTPKIDYNKF